MMYKPLLAYTICSLTLSACTLDRKNIQIPDYYQACIDVQKIAAERKLEKYIIEPTKNQIRPLSKYEVVKLKSATYLPFHKQFIPIPEAIYELPIDNNWNPFRLSIVPIGSVCPAKITVNIDTLLASEGENSGYEGQGIHYYFNSLFGGSEEYLINLKNQYYVIKYIPPDKNFIKSISLIEHDGRITPMCYFQNIKDLEFVVTKSHDDKVCQPIISGKAQPMQGKLIESKQLNSSPERLANEAKLFSVDTNGDGLNEYLVRFKFNPKNGCGNSLSWFRELNSELKYLEKNNLNELLEKEVDSNLHYGYSSYEHEIYQIDNNYYIRLNDVLTGKQRVLQIKGSSIKKVCEFNVVRTDGISYKF